MLAASGGGGEILVEKLYLAGKKELCSYTTLPQLLIFQQMHTIKFRKYYLFLMERKGKEDILIAVLG